MRDLLALAQPTKEEFAFVIIMVLVVPNVGIAIIDIVIHDGYIGKVVAFCHPGQIATICEEVRFEQDVEAEDQIGLAGSYAEMLFLIQLGIAIGYIIFRFSVGLLAGHTLNLMLIITSLVWGLSALSLFVTGWADFLYYVLRGLPLPEILPWLDGVGLFPLVNGIGATASVDLIELYVLMGIGFGIFLAPWIFLMHKMSTGELEELGLIQELD